MLSKLKSIIIAFFIAASLSLPTSAQQDLIFITADGTNFPLSQLRGKVVVLIFGGVQDPQCKDEFKALESLAERYQGKDVAIYWVSVNSARELTDAQLKSPCGPVTAVGILRDQNQAAFKRFSGKVAQLPTIVMLNQQGEPSGQPRGGFNPNSDFVNDIASLIDRLLKK